MERYLAKIIEIVPSAAESSEHLVTVNIKFQVNEFQFWAFVHEWRKYFPYWKNSKWNASNYLPKLIGKKMPIKLKFLDLVSTKCTAEEKKLVAIKNQRNPCVYYLFGQIIEKKPDSKVDFAETGYIDCGFIVETGLKKSDDFKIGDFIKIKGRLDAFFLEDPKNVL